MPAGPVNQIQAPRAFALRLRYRFDEQRRIRIRIEFYFLHCVFRKLLPVTQRNAVAGELRAVHFAIFAPDLDGFHRALRRILRITRACREMRGWIEIDHNMHAAGNDSDRVCLRSLEIPLADGLHLNSSRLCGLVKTNSAGQKYAADEFSDL